jgi:hypothetical protein
LETYLPFKLGIHRQDGPLRAALTKESGVKNVESLARAAHLVIDLQGE